MTTVRNMRGDVIELVQDYINIDRMKDEIFNLLKNEVESYGEDDENDYLLAIYDDDALNERAFAMADRFNCDMKKYLHMDEHKLCGNFNNVEYDYVHFRTGESKYDDDMLREMIARLDAGEESEQATADREFLTDWFWETFGTFGITYNFQTELGEMLYEYEREVEASIA